MKLTKRAVARISEAYQSWGDTVTMKTREKYLERWMEVCGVSDPMQIDYENPFVKIEWWLCDFRILNSIKKEKGRQEFYKLIGEEATQVYLNYVGENGVRYTDLEHNHVATAVRRACQRATKKKTE